MHVVLGQAGVVRVEPTVAIAAAAAAAVAAAAGVGAAAVSVVVLVTVCSIARQSPEQAINTSCKMTVVLGMVGV